MQKFLFDFPQLKITKKIRLIELFGGIGSQAMALRDIGADFEYYRLVEFDKYAVQSYNAIHDTRHTTHDIRDIHAKDLGIVEKDKYCYLMTYSFPCTDLSVAGKMQGMSKADWENGNSTRSGLLWEVERILKECKDDELPNVLLMENVPQVHAEQNRADFNNWLNFLKSKGYKNFWKDLNAKDYGIPQSRNRCFMVSILSDEFVEYEFPKPQELKTVMKDYLEKSVDEKYYIKSEKADKLIESEVLPTENREQRTENRERGMKEVKVMGTMDNTIDHTFESANRVYDKLGLWDTIPTCAGGNIQPKIIEDFYANRPARVYEKVAPTIRAEREGLKVIENKKEIKKVGQISSEGSEYGTIIHEDGLCPTLVAGTHGYANSCICASEKMIVAMRGRNPENPTDRTAGIHTEQRLEPNPRGIANTLTTVQKDNLVQERGCQYRIRKLTPKECFRLMSFRDEDFEAAKNAGVSDSQLYKQAGNSICECVLKAIFAKML